MTDAAPLGGMAAWDIFPYTGDIRPKTLDPPVLPEPPRSGEDGGAPCGPCAADDSGYLWANDHWRVFAPRRPPAIPAILFLETRDHFDLADLPTELAEELGPMVQRVERAMLSLDGVGRVHVSRWGDGAAHFHLWFFARPAGQRQLLGAFLPLWNDILPPMSGDAWARNKGLLRESLRMTEPKD